ncbi:MAG: DUF819 family protein [Phycisphaerae bacterium]|nr:DUF819 family protein [Phycisphaerae bacterium]
MRVASLPDLMIILALGFGACWVSYKGADLLAAGSVQYVKEIAVDLGLEEIKLTLDAEPVPLDSAQVKPHHVGHAIDEALQDNPAGLDSLSTWSWLRYHVSRFVNETTGGSMWKYVFVTTLGLLLSFTRVRNLEGAGASKIGSVMLYLLVACIGASADFKQITEAPGYVVAGFIWMAVHITVLLTVAWLIKAPIFFVAVGSQANIGGAASAPIVAAAYHPALAPVGVLLAVAGYVLGTYAGLLCAGMLKAVAGAA